MRAFVLVDLGFGDAGKGLMTDFLVRRTGAEVVVRYNGGAQAGHNVVTPDGRHHTFSQLGAGSFLPRTKTFLSRHVVVHPTALLQEAHALSRKGVPDALDRLGISDQALLITPFHQAVGRLRELARGTNRHGSCGVGVGETVHDRAIAPASALRAGDLCRPRDLREKLEAAHERMVRASSDWRLLLARDPRARSEFEVLDRAEIAARWSAAASTLAHRVVGDEILGRWLRKAGTAVFEGAQGVLLDEDVGFHPYTTWSRCTPENAFELIRESGAAAATQTIGVLRTCAVRHGPGPLPTETAELAGSTLEHNGAGEWQGAVRYGWFDTVLGRYALSKAAGVDSLAVTHCDLLDRISRWRWCAAYVAPADSQHSDDPMTPLGSEVRDLPGPRGAASLQFQEQLGSWIARARPQILEAAPVREVVTEICERELGRPVEWIASGPRADNVRVLAEERSSRCPAS
jgi:adenylosuccinate synthase